MSSSHFAHAPDAKPALVFNTGATLDYGTLDHRANQAAHLFRSLGLQRGDGVAILMENQPQFAVLVTAASRAGLYFCCISTQLAVASVRHH